MDKARVMLDEYGQKYRFNYGQGYNYVLRINQAQNNEYFLKLKC